MSELIAQHGEYRIEYVEHSNQWRAWLGTSELSKQYTSLLEAKEACDRHLKAENPFKRIPCLVRKWEYQCDNKHRQGEVTSIDGDSVWVSCEGKRSKEIKYNVFAQTPKNLQIIENYETTYKRLKTETKTNEETLKTLTLAVQ
jgi:hypothetical protein